MLITDKELAATAAMTLTRVSFYLRSWTLVWRHFDPLNSGLKNFWVILFFLFFRVAAGCSASCPPASAGPWCPRTRGSKGGARVKCLAHSQKWRWDCEGRGNYRRSSKARGWNAWPGLFQVSEVPPTSFPEATAGQCLFLDAICSLNLCYISKLLHHFLLFTSSGYCKKNVLGIGESLA